MRPLWASRLREVRRFGLVVLAAVAAVSLFAYSLRPSDWGGLGRVLVGAVTGWSLAVMLKRWPRR